MNLKSLIGLALAAVAAVAIPYWSGRLACSDGFMGCRLTDPHTIIWLHGAFVLICLISALFMGMVVGPAILFGIIPRLGSGEDQKAPAAGKTKKSIWARLVQWLVGYAPIVVLAFCGMFLGYFVAARLDVPQQVFFQTADRAAFLQSLARETVPGSAHRMVLLGFADCMKSKKDSDETALDICKWSVARGVEANAKAAGSDDQTVKLAVAKAEIEMEEATAKLLGFEADRLANAAARITK